MFRTTLAILAAAACALAAGPNTCTSYPVKWTVNSLYIDGVTPASIANDGAAAYENGKSGVQATISNCGDKDAVLALGNATRSVFLNFTDPPIYANSYTPAGLPGNTVKALSLDVRNVLYVPPDKVSDDYTFTTRMGINLGSFAFRMINPNSQAMPPTADDNMANYFYQDALVYVHHCPASSGVGTCRPLAHETWYVYPNLVSATPPYPPPYVGTVILTIGNGKNAYSENGGQFSMPFYFAISKLN